MATLLLLAALAACRPAASPPYPGAVSAVPSSEATRLTGRVTAAPTCPVERASPDPSCAERPVAGAVLVVEDASGREVARTESGADGGFTVTLTPGRYRLVPQPKGGLLGTPQPIPFQVEARGSMAPISVRYDTGIR